MCKIYLVDTETVTVDKTAEERKETLRLAANLQKRFSATKEFSIFDAIWDDVPNTVEAVKAIEESQ